MKEYTKAKIVADLQQDLFQFLDDDQLKADALSYLLDPHIELKTHILRRYSNYLPVSDDKRIQQIRKIFADDFLLKYPQHKRQLERISDKRFVDIEEQLAYIISYKIEGYIKNVYEVNVPRSTDTYFEGKNYLQSLASAVAGTPNAEKLEWDDITLVIYETVQNHLNELEQKKIYPSAPRNIVYVDASDNNYAFLLNVTSTLSGILSVASFTVAALAIESIITISTAGVGLIAGVGVVAALVSFGLYKNGNKQENLGDQVKMVLQLQ